MQDKLPAFIRRFLQLQYPDPKDIPVWVRNALASVNVET